MLPALHSTSALSLNYLALYNLLQLVGESLKYHPSWHQICLQGLHLPSPILPFAHLIVIRQDFDI